MYYIEQQIYQFSKIPINRIVHYANQCNLKKINSNKYVIFILFCCNKFELESKYILLAMVECQLESYFRRNYRTVFVKLNKVYSMSDRSFFFLCSIIRIFDNPNQSRSQLIRIIGVLLQSCCPKIFSLTNSRTTSKSNDRKLVYYC